MASGKAQNVFTSFNENRNVRNHAHYIKEQGFSPFLHTTVAKLSETVRNGFSLINREKKWVRIW